VSTLKALGISSRVNLEKIRKRVAKRTFEGMPQKTKPLPPQGEACLYLCFCCV
jgi:hypothetical protein